MDKWTAEFKRFVKNKKYMLALVLTAIFSYGFLITHQTVGIDDTPYSLYFDEGLATIVGRWVLFLINKLFHIAEFAPFVTDLAGVMIFMAGVTVWCVLFRRVLGDTVPMYGYILFSCLFLSNPLISEVYTYYLHNGVAIGYLSCGISLCFLWESLSGRGFGTDERAAAAQPSGEKTAEGKTAGGKTNGKERKCKKKSLLWMGSAAGLWVAIGCYESFMIVYLVGVCILLCMARLAQIPGGQISNGKIFRKRAHRGAGEKKSKEAALIPVIRSLIIAALIAGISIILRSVMIQVLTCVFNLSYLKEQAVQRSITEMVGWIMQPGAFGEFVMMVKRVLVMYGVFAYAYYPILVYVIAVAAALMAGVIWTVRRKDPWIFLLVLGGIGTSYLLVIVEGKATYYRSAQFLPVFCAWGLLFAVYSLNQLITKKVGLKWCNRIVCFILCVILWNQCTDMNHWFYVDWMKYEDARETVDNIAYELEKSFDTSKPVYFAGVHTVPKSIIKDAYVDYGSGTYYKMLNLTTILDPHLLEKFNRDYGVWVAQAPALSVLDWGRQAFDNNEEIIRFFSIHGHELVPYSKAETYADIEEEAKDMPHFPREGSIVDKGDYILVHF